jgi:hypothetical protein
MTATAGSQETTASVLGDLGFPADGADAAIHDEQARRRALEAYHFFYLTVSMHGIVEGTRQSGAIDGESAMLLLAGPRHVGFTLNSDTPYSGGVLDLCKSGPIVIELPPGPLVGLVDDHHQRWIADLGLPGPDEGRGGKHLVLPPDYDGETPEQGYFLARSDTWLSFCALRALPLRGDVEAALQLMRSIKIYPLDHAVDPPPYELMNQTDNPGDVSCLRWEDNLEFWRVLHGVIDSEPTIEEMRAMLGALAELGIQAGEPFAPDGRMRRILQDAAHEGRDQMLVAAFASDRPDRMVWEDRTWEWVGLRPENGEFERNGSLDVEARDRWFAQAIVASPAMFRRAVGQGSLYWLAHRDGEGRYLDGGRTYKLTVPLPVPASLFWSVTAYDARTRSEVQAPQDQAALRSLFEDLDGDGAAIDLYFGPERPGGVDGRWLQTVPDRGWFSYFRIYGPQASAFDGAWKPGDFQVLS